MSTAENTSQTMQHQAISGSNDSPKFVPALIVVDMQNDFVSGSLAVPGGETIIKTINSLIDLPFEIRIATRDLHPANHVSFAETHQKPVFSKAMIYHPEDVEEATGIEQVLWPVHCVAHTAGADFVAEMNSARFDFVVHKGTHPKVESYSAFRDVWGRHETELPGMLKARGVTDVYFVGLAGDYCVKYTAMDATEYGYQTWVVTDAIKSIAEKERTHFDEMALKGVKFTTAKDVEAVLATSR